MQPHGQQSHRLFDLIPKPVMTQSYGTWERGNRGSEIKSKRSGATQSPLTCALPIISFRMTTSLRGEDSEGCKIFVSFVRRRTRSFSSAWQKQKRFLCLTDFVAGAAVQDAAQLAELSRGIVKVSNPLSRNV